MNEAATFRVPVRELCEFSAKRGDLDLRFTPSPSAQQGIAGHATVTARRGAGYVRELPLQAEQGLLRVRGRADGFDAAQGILEEIKTYRGELDRIPDNHRHLHWAQLKVYGAMLCRSRGLAALCLRLTYFNVDSGMESSTTEAATAVVLDAFFAEQTTCFIEWALQEQTHREQRGRALAALHFPHAGFNVGQRQLSVAVYRAATQGTSLLVEAPTGIGKTLGTIFPTLKAAASEGIDKIFYLTARTSGRALALDALKTLRTADAGALRVLELTAREKACEHPGLACHGESCPLARGFFDRLAAARSAAVQQRWLDRTAIRAVAAEHRVCPYYLSQELVRWADVVVSDYNYYFDASASLHALTVINEWNVVLLVDEAHNLVDRGRAMYSASLLPAAFQAVRRGESGATRRALDRLSRAWNALGREQTQREVVTEQLPVAFIETLRKTLATLGEVVAEPVATVSPALLNLFFELGGFLRLVDSFGEHSLFVMEQTPGSKQATLAIQNVVPASFLAPRLAAAKAAILFTATLGPPRYFRDMVGVADSAIELGVPSPFRAEQLDVRIAPLSTRLADRDRSIPRIVAIIVRQLQRVPGNYLAFFSSYAYLEQVHHALRDADPELPVWKQSPRMSEDQRDAFLGRFEHDGHGVGLAVLGGAFAEGIDLVGSRLVGAFIATLGSPQVNRVNDAMKARVDGLFGRGTGFDYIYRYPGLRRVVQAAGRVIRTLDDSGTVILIEDRFNSAPVRQLLPAWWSTPVQDCSG